MRSSTKARFAGLAIELVPLLSGRSVAGERFSEESSRYNIGSLRRTINLPGRGLAIVNSEQE